MKSQLWRQLALVTTLVAVSAVTAHAQPGGRGGRTGFGGFGSRGGSSIFGRLMSSGGGAARFALRSDVQKELDLDDDQVDEIKAIQESNAPDVRSLFQDAGIDMRSIFSMSREEQEKALEPVMKQVQEGNAKLRKEVMELLTSKQKTRLNQLQFQFAVYNGNLADAMTTVGEKVSKSDKDDINEAKREADEELVKVRQELYAKALGGIVGMSKVEEMLGSKFKFSADAGDRGRRAQGRGRGRDSGDERGGRAGGRGRGGDTGGNNPRRRARPSSDDESEDSNPRRRRGE